MPSGITTTGVKSVEEARRRALSVENRHHSASDNVRQFFMNRQFSDRQPLHLDIREVGKRLYFRSRLRRRIAPIYHEDWDIRPFSKIEESRTVANAVESASTNRTEP